MLVRHNQLKERDLFHKFWWSSGVNDSIVSVTRNSSTLKFILKQESYTGSLFGNELSLEGNDYGKVVFENLGNLPISIGGLNESFTIEPNSKKVVKITKNKSAFWVYTANGYNYKGQLQVLKLSQLMVTNELVNIYLPNISTLSEDKQPLLPPEGNYKEITPL